MPPRKIVRAHENVSGEALPQVFIGEIREVFDPFVPVGDSIGHHRQMLEYRSRHRHQTAVVGKTFLQVLVRYGFNQTDTPQFY